ncbi:hypothetical protein OUZ56_014955 [Daphnia magna]|uniref:GMP synthase n=1 Tax=Daphnia magna TaxID=35525 RepID=A0ABR0ALC2_9CRUS|nr:hypothetical protein OUZ56_014955 [Daphnia magna]
MSAFTVATTMVKKENVEIYVGLNPVLSPYSDMEQIKEPACKIILDGEHVSQTKIRNSYPAESNEFNYCFSRSRLFIGISAESSGKFELF